MATNTGHVMNLANSIIGVSLLAMPFCFKQCGITLAIVMLILSSMISRLACHFLVKSSTMCRKRNFELLAFYTFGPSGKLLVELGVIGFLMGTCVAFFVVMGDLGPAIISKIFNISNNGTLRTSVLMSLGVLVVLPLGLLRNVESLAAISTATIGFYFLFIIKVFFESLSHLITGDWWLHVNFWQPEGVLQCIPIFAMALSCQTQLFEIYESLPTPTIEKMNSVVHSALNLCTLLYTSVGLLGYIAYYKGNFTGNILLSFTPSLSSEMFKLGFVMSIAVSFPLVIFPCRASLYSLIFRRMPIHYELSQTSSHIPDSRFKCLTIVIVAVALTTGLLIPSIELVLGFVGSTIGVAICVIFPSLSFLNLTNKNTNERFIAKAVLFIGLIIMVLGTFGNLFAAVENKSYEASASKLSETRNLPQLKVPHNIEVTSDSVKNYKNEILVFNPVPPEKLLSFKAPDSLKPETVKGMLENQRIEPPIPVAPVVNGKGNQKILPPSIRIVEKKKETLINKEYSNKAENQEKDVVRVLQSKSKSSDVINKDAIEKEERELMELEKQKKTEEDQKQQELLKILKEHQDAQKKLLREQEKILDEIKHRENEKKLNEVLKDKEPMTKELNLLLDVVKTIKPEEFKVNINKIQNVINDLKDTKNNLEKDKILKKDIFSGIKSNGKDTAISEGKNHIQFSSKKILKQEEKDVNKNVMGSVPLPLVKLQSGSELKKLNDENVEKKSVKSKQAILGRDILVEEKIENALGREKRDANNDEALIKNNLINFDEGECEKNENGQSHSNVIKLTNKTDENDSKGIVTKKSLDSSAGEKKAFDIIKNSKHLTVGLTNEENGKINDIDSSKLISEVSQPLISKKRDLK